LARVCLGVPKAEDGRIALRFCCSATIEQTQEHQVYNGKNPLRSSRTTTTTTTTTTTKTCHDENQKLYRKRIQDSKTHKPTHNRSILLSLESWYTHMTWHGSVFQSTHMTTWLFSCNRHMLSLLIPPCRQRDWTWQLASSLPQQQVLNAGGTKVIAYISFFHCLPFTWFSFCFPKKIMGDAQTHLGPWLSYAHFVCVLDTKDHTPQNVHNSGMQTCLGSN
jgi:hypothetical protein